jgi:hypothetical protein
MRATARTSGEAVLDQLRRTEQADLAPAIAAVRLHNGADGVVGALSLHGATLLSLFVVLVGAAPGMGARIVKGKIENL